MNPENTVKHLGGTYLKPGTLKKPAHCTVSARNGGARTVEGKFGLQLEIPTTIDGMEFVLSIPADKGDGKVLRTVFGEDLGAWSGKGVVISDSDVLNRVRIQPA